MHGDFQIEQMGFRLSAETPNPFPGNSTEHLICETENMASYWPFRTREEAFEYLDTQFNSNIPGCNPRCLPKKAEGSLQSRLIN